MMDPPVYGSEGSFRAGFADRWLWIGVQTRWRSGKASHNNKSFHDHSWRDNSFSMIFGDDTNGGEDPDQLLGQSEGVYLSYSIDGGNTYTDIAHYLTTLDLNTETA